MKKKEKLSPCYGAVTLPAESGQEKIVLKLTKKWGADVIRDSDGTHLSDEMLKMGYKIYSTLCLVRADQKWPKKHPEHLHSLYLMSDPVAASGKTVHVDPMEKFCREKYRPDLKNDPKKYWEVIDRTNGRTLNGKEWTVNRRTGVVTIKGAWPSHVYTVNFLARQTWDSTSMYNHIVNKWTCDPIVSVDPYYKECYQHLMDYFDKWLESHGHTDIVRFTTFAYHFTIIAGKGGGDKYRDWLGYTDTISVPALKDFAKKKKYRIRPEHFVDKGYYNATYRVPSKEYLDWMNFIHSFVVKFAKELVKKAHRAGKKTAMFQGDHWIGTEVYSDDYKDIGIDIDIGAVECGVALRRLSDAPGPQAKEARFYPYFFPDVFRKGGNPKKESVSNWMQIRRAILRKRIDRIGYGGYLSLAAKFPEFVDHVTLICDEFRSILINSKKSESLKAPIKVAVLNAWGKWRSWLQNTGVEQKFYIPSRIDVTETAGSNPLECLSGLPVEVKFINFEDIRKNGIPAGTNVIINTGDAETAWSGGHHWADPEVTAVIREWILGGGGFVGIGGPTAFEHGGRYFQLSDVMGVEKETGNTIASPSVRFKVAEKHFITEDQPQPISQGSLTNQVYLTDKKAEVLKSAPGGHVLMATNKYGKGRSVFIANLPYSLSNSRLLLRTLFWVTGKEKAIKKWFSSNINTDCAFYPKTGYLAVINNVGSTEKTEVYDGKGKKKKLTLKPHELKWIKIRR